MPKPRKKPEKPLTLLEIDRVSMVDKGDNPTAHILIHKRADIDDEGENDSLDHETVKGEQMELNQVMEKLTALGETVAKAEQRAARAEGIAKLTAEERQHFDKQSAADQDAFLNGDAEFRKAKIEAAKPAPVEKTADQLRIEQLEKREHDLSERVRKAEDAAELAQFTKRARTELPNTPGTDEEKGAMLRAVEKIADPQARDIAMKALKAGDAAQASLTKVVGSNSAMATGGAEERMAAKVEECRKADHKLTKGAAWEIVVKQHPDLWAEYNAERKGVN